MANRVIILEGPDGSGKTQLARSLEQHLNFRIVKCNQPKKNEDMLRSYTSSLYHALCDWRPVVFDRHYLGEGIYGPVMRGQDRLTEYGRVLIERMIAAYGVQMVVCLPGEDVGWLTCQERGETFVTKREQYDQIYRGFVDAANRLACYTYNWRDTTSLPFQALTEVFGARRILDVGVTGSPTAETLMVGERANASFYNFSKLPFHSLGGCSPWLYEVGKEAGLDEERTAWINAYDYNNNPINLRAVVESLPRLRRVISLGDDAANLCRRNLADHVALYTMPHPQYWKCFQSKQRQSYVQLLADNLKGNEL